MKRQFIVTAPIDYGRHELEEALWPLEERPTQEEMTKIMYENLEFQLWDLQDFVTYCNDEEFSVDDCWMTYVTVEVPDDYNPNRSTWYSNLIRF